MGGIASYVAKKYNIPLVITEHSSVERGVYVKKSYYKRIIESYKVQINSSSEEMDFKKEMKKLGWS